MGDRETAGAHQDQTGVFSHPGDAPAQHKGKDLTDEEVCALFLRDPTRNPRTGRRITPKGKAYRELVALSETIGGNPMTAQQKIPPPRLRVASAAGGRSLPGAGPKMTATRGRSVLIVYGDIMPDRAIGETKNVLVPAISHVASCARKYRRCFGWRADDEFPEEEQSGLRDFLIAAEEEPGVLSEIVRRPDVEDVIVLLYYT